MTYRIPRSIVGHLRDWGLTVVEYDGWLTRGAGFPAKPLVIVDHHTGTPDTVQGDYPTKNVVIIGRSDLPGPLCQFGLGRSGTVYLVAAGKANHAGKGSWDGVDVGNSHSVGVEAESAGGGHWTAAQLHAYPLLNAALCAFLEIPARRVCAHRESALPHGRKDDPVGIDMTRMRTTVAQLLVRGPHPARPPAVTPPPIPVPTVLEETDMHLIHAPSHSETLVTDDGRGNLVLRALTASQARTLGKTLRRTELTDAEYRDYIAAKTPPAPAP